jgi:O-Antigen ligase
MPSASPSQTRRRPMSGNTAAPIRSHVTARANGLYLVFFLATLALTPLFILIGASQGFTQVLAALAALVALALVPWRPIFGLYVVVTCALVVEQEPLVTGPIGTDHLYIFSWPASLQGNIERPIGYLMLAILAVLAIAGVLFRRRAISGGRLFYPFLVLLGCLALGVLYGLATGGTFRIIVLEVRPWWYFFLSYILAYNVVRSASHIRVILWLIVLGTAFKGVQGVYIVNQYLGGQVGGHNEIMAHEQSYFFVLVLLLLVLMALHQFQRWLFVAILLSLPCLLIALVANNRRADYVALLIGIAVVWVLAIAMKPESRRKLVTTLVICTILGAGYVVAFQNAGGALGEPARAVTSIFNPSSADARDAASNLYRTVENYDLKYTAAQYPIMYGFGKPFLQPIPLANVVELDPYYLYVPHNNVLWIWMRLGPLGFGALWYLIGAAVVAGCFIARKLKDRQLQFFALFTIAALVMEVILAYGDYQFFFYRNMIFVGVLLGALMKLPAIERAATGTIDQDDTDESIENVSRRAVRARRVRSMSPLPLPAALVGAADSGRLGKWKIR